MAALHANSPLPSIYASDTDREHTGEAWASAAHENPWNPVILSLDGGGMRGYSSLLILQDLMIEVARWEDRLRDAIPFSDPPVTSDPPTSPLAHAISVGGTVSGASLDPATTIATSTSDGANSTAKTQDIVDPIAKCISPSTGRTDPDKLLPCHYFDFMYGTSTGGLIATMLARLRMSVPQALAKYRSMGDPLFGRQRSRLPLRTKYDHVPLERAVSETVRENCKRHSAKDECDGQDYFAWKHDDALFDAVAADGTPIDWDRHICQAICLSAVHNGRIDVAHLLRTYDHRYYDIPNWINPYNEGSDTLRIWEVTRATSAAPFYFEPLEVVLNGEKWIFKDGGIRENNPARAAWSEFVSRYGERNHPTLLLSVGTGRPDEVAGDGFATAWPGPFGNATMMRKLAEKFAVLKNLMIKYTDGEGVHRGLLSVASGESSWYKRLNVSTGLEGMKLDEWASGPWRNPYSSTDNSALKVVPGGATMTKVEDATRAYLTRDIDHDHDTYAPPKVMISQIAEKLVRQRLARRAVARENPNRWDTYMGRYLDPQRPQPSGYTDGPMDPSQRPVLKDTEAADAHAGASETHNLLNPLHHLFHHKSESTKSINSSISHGKGKGTTALGLGAAPASSSAAVPGPVGAATALLSPRPPDGESAGSEGRRSSERQAEAGRAEVE